MQRLQRSVEQLNRGNQKAVQQVQSAGAVGAGMNGVGVPGAFAGVARGYSPGAVNKNWLRSAEYELMNARALAEWHKRLGGTSSWKEFSKKFRYGTRNFLDNLSRSSEYSGNPSFQLYNKQKEEYNN